MVEQTGETISALIDGEIPEGDLAAVIRELNLDDAACGCWQRYQLISDALSNHLPDALDLGLAARVSQALESEPTVLSPKPRRVLPMQLPKHLAGLSVAASVAVMAVLGAQWITQRDTATGVGAVANVAALQPTAGYMRVSGTRWNLHQPAVESRLNNYLVNHSEYANSSAMHGMLPYVRIAGYDAE